MKLTTLLLIIGCVHVCAAGFSQKIHLKEKNITLQAVFSKMEKQSGYTFFSNSDYIKALPSINVNIRNATLKDALETVLSKLSLTYSIVGKTVVIQPDYEPVIIPEKPGPRIYIGHVLDENDKPLAGVGVKFKEANSGVITDKNGFFTTKVTEDLNAVLVFTYIGYVQQEIPVSKLKVPIIIKLVLANSDLDQIQVMAYSQTTKRLNTSNTYTITAEEIAKNPVPNVLQVLKDRVPGMFIEQATGLAGGSFNIKIRGNSSFGDNAPLFIIDGVTYPANTKLPIAKPAGTDDQFLGGNALNYINPADIERIDVLKDADATSIYGSRGAYGVVLITTKKAKGGKPRLNINTNTGIVMMGNYQHMLNTEQYVMLRKEAVKNDGLVPGIGDLDINGAWPEDRYTNWQKELQGNQALTNTVNVNYSGGTGNTTFLLGANLNKKGSIDQGKGSDRGGTVRFDIQNETPDKKFYIQLTGSYSSTINDVVPIDYTGNISTRSAPNAPSLFLPDGSLNWEQGENPYAALNISYKNVTNNFIANTSLRYKPVKGFTFTLMMGYNVLSTNEFRATPTTAFNPATNSIAKTVSYVNNFTLRNINIDPNVKYETVLGKGKLIGLLGGTLQSSQTDINRITGNNFISDALLVNPSTAVSVTSFYDKVPTKYLGFFASVNYNWDDKYIINITGRRDGSTKFGPGHRWGDFGAIGAAWLISEEKWFKDNIGFISFAKLNGSYGTSGGDGVTNYQYLSRYNAQSIVYQGKTSLLPSSPENPNLHWELSKKSSLSLTLEFLKGRIGLEGNYYKTISTNLIVYQPISSITGFVQYPINSSAKIENTGYEFLLNTRNIVHKDFTWSSNFVITIPRNKLASFNGLESSQLNFDFEVGKSLGNKKLFQYAGVDPETGYYFFTTAAGVTGQNLFTLNQTSDKVASVDTNPIFYGSFSNSFTYKNLNLSFAITGRKRMGPNYLGQQLYTFGMFNQNSSVTTLSRWQKPGDITEIPKVSTNGLYAILQQNNFRQSTGAYEMITYARLQNVNLSYNFSNTFLKKANINVLNVFIQGQNLFTMSKYGDMDPESLSVTATPPLRVFTAGINITL